ncbi:hypothetical protein GCM10010478_40040 [Streptomyces erythrogriseus]|uniref:Uncharacterized protein n=2 Tax=Streptomyces griseoincarnatus group TaxID=2867193 RepID=A0ABN3X3N5_9ACTN|nr:hypothetical protein GCM10010265_17560 [Streptomyces griseoincarnatus]GGT39697.1 hypothetical protein GCM10010287_10670 [Streptomyces variabilis]
MAEGESDEQVQRDGREAHASGEAAQQAQDEDDRAQFDEHGGGVVHGRRSSGSVTAASVPEKGSGEMRADGGAPGRARDPRVCGER